MCGKTVVLVVLKALTPHKSVNMHPFPLPRHSNPTAAVLQRSSLLILGYVDLNARILVTFPTYSDDMEKRMRV